MSLKYAKKRSGNFLFLLAKSVVLTVAKQIIHHWKALVMVHIMKVEVKKALFNFASKKIHFWAYFNFIKVCVFDERNTYNKYQSLPL